MRRHLSPEDIANDIRMTRSQHRGAFVLVEGETADLRVYDRFVDNDRCQLIPAHGKENVLGVIEILDGEEFSGILGIVDADRTRVSGRLPKSDNVVMTDGCDLESMLIHSPALDKVLAEFGSEEKLRKLEAKLGSSVRENLQELTRPLGALRYVSEREELSLTFQGLKFSRFVDRKTMAVDPSKLIRAVRDNSRVPRLDEKWLGEEVRALLTDRSVPSRHLGHGHDMVAMLSIGLRAALGSQKRNDVSPEILERSLRLAYEEGHFRSSELFKAILDWESRNPPFKILRPLPESSGGA